VEEEWKKVVMQSERQLNGSDCGVFACLNVLALVRGAEPGEISPDNGMMEARRLIVATLLKNSSHEKKRLTKACFPSGFVCLNVLVYIPYGCITSLLCAQ